MRQTTIEICEAQQSDLEFVISLIESALNPFYGGDHRAHAIRIFDAHISGGKDMVGHFSAEQKMFIAKIEEKPVGVIHVVGKKQRTFKISPLVVHPQFRGGYGIGNALIKFAEGYAKSREAKQMYCTVAKQNIGALQFFMRNGYIIGGSSVNHYKQGITEMMLYKPFVDDKSLDLLDELTISVVPFDEIQHANAVRELILSTLPKHFDGIDDSWVQALFNGWHRRDSKDINQKYKLIYVAMEKGEVVGVVGATPKKGEPIKLMPLVAKYPAAFMALLTDVPQLLQEYGHKLYTHIVPSVEQVVLLQRFYWSLDCMLPAAYHDEYITQQWSYSYEGGLYMRHMRIKRKFINLIREGKKTLEVRVGYSSIKNIKIGERIILTTQREDITVCIKAVRVYPSFMEMLKKEDSTRIVPGMDKQTLSNLLKSFYPPEKEKLGVFVFEVEMEK